MQFNDYHWDMVSKYIGINDIKSVLYKNKHNVNSYNQCKTFILNNMFEQVYIYCKDIKNKSKVLEFFTGYLIPKGFIPRVNTSSHISISKYEFIDEYNNLQSWNIPNVSIIRHYWDTLECDDWYLDKFHANILKLLPGKKVKCLTCKWNMPQMEMELDDLCTYCKSVEKCEQVVRVKDKLFLSSNINYIKLKIL
jgi:hypothetical protein